MGVIIDPRLCSGYLKVNTRFLLELYRCEQGDRTAVNRLLLHYLNSLGVIDDDALQKRLLKDLIRNYVILEKRVDALLKNTLPETIAEEIKYKDTYRPRPFVCTILFFDLVGFTHLAEKMSAEVLIKTLHAFFIEVDDLIEGFEGTKIKTIGDAYMAVFGAPTVTDNHAETAVRAAMDLLRTIERFNEKKNLDFQVRVGIHSGPVMAGVVGKERMQFDVFGDNVNIASRFESSGEKGKINVSEETYKRTRGLFTFEQRGMISLKNKPQMKAYFVTGEK